MTLMLFQEINPNSWFFNGRIPAVTKERCLSLPFIPGTSRPIKITEQGMIPLTHVEWYEWLIANNGMEIAEGYAMCFPDMKTKVMFLLKFQKPYFD